MWWGRGFCSGCLCSRDVGAVRWSGKWVERRVAIVGALGKRMGRRSTRVYVKWHRGTEIGCCDASLSHFFSKSSTTVKGWCCGAGGFGMWRLGDLMWHCGALFFFLNQSELEQSWNLRRSVRTISVTCHLFLNSSRLEHS